MAEDEPIATEPTEPTPIFSDILPEGWTFEDIRDLQELVKTSSTEVCHGLRSEIPIELWEMVGIADVQTARGA